MPQDGKYTIVKDIYERLRELAVVSQLNEPIGVKMILNSSFLVEKEEEFARRLSELDEEYGDRLKFNCVGPLPPHNFVNLELEWR